MNNVAGYAFGDGCVRTIGTCESNALWKSMSWVFKLDFTDALAYDAYHTAKWQVPNNMPHHTRIAALYANVTDDEGTNVSMGMLGTIGASGGLGGLCFLSVMPHAPSTSISSTNVRVDACVEWADLSSSLVVKADESIHLLLAAFNIIGNISYMRVHCVLSLFTGYHTLLPQRTCYAPLPLWQGPHMKWQKQTWLVQPQFVIRHIFKAKYVLFPPNIYVRMCTIHLQT